MRLASHSFDNAYYGNAEHFGNSFTLSHYCIKCICAYFSFLRIYIYSLALINVNGIDHKYNSLRTKPNVGLCLCAYICIILNEDNLFIISLNQLRILTEYKYVYVRLTNLSMLNIFISTLNINFKFKWSLDPECLCYCLKQQSMYEKRRHYKKFLFELWHSVELIYDVTQTILKTSSNSIYYKCKWLPLCVHSWFYFTY